METPNALAAERLAWLMDSWTSVEVRTLVAMRNHQASGDEMQYSSTTTTNHYIETVDGKRAFEEHTVSSDGAPMTCNYYTDGTQSATVYIGTLPNGEETESVMIRRSFGMDDRGWHHCPEPLMYFYAGLRPLHVVLADADYLGTSRHLDRDCHVFLVDRTAGKIQQDTVYHLDQATAIPLKVCMYQDEDTRAGDQPTTVWAAKSFDEVGGRPFPLNSEQRIYLADNPSKPYIEREIVVESLTFDQSYPTSTFQPTPGPRARVLNEITREFTPPKEEATFTEVSQPIRAVPNRNWSDSVPTLTLGFGLLVLTTSVVLWWRRR
ncbi:hypothetical protein AB1L88_17165 [Tautonia sp. JC769]|uniref:hypothetical protein n=1 Tax=Tautonia sp. JC769 TaxID=3232135 RepID=UPI00345AA7C2